VFAYVGLPQNLKDLKDPPWRQAWFATFHLVLVLISVFTTVGAFGTALSVVRIRPRGGEEEEENGPASGVFGGRAFVPLEQEASAIEKAAHLCTLSFCWWTLFNVYSALRASLLIPSTPGEVSVAVAGNWLLSELLPSLAISLSLSRHVARLAPTAGTYSYGKIGAERSGVGVEDSGAGVGRGVFRQGSELLAVR
jgi:hypothetical protein